MARKAPSHNLEPVLEAAKRWIDTCMIRDRSILVDKPLWTLDLTGELGKAFVESPDDRREVPFHEKLKQQLSGCSDDAKLLMAEMLWALRLFPSNIKAPTKRKIIQDVWSWAHKRLPNNLEALSDDVLVGIGSAGQAYNRGIWRELRFLIVVTSSLKALDQQSRMKIFSDYDAHIQWVSALPEEGYRQFRHMLRYFCFPTRVERIATDRDQRRILDAFGVASDSQVHMWQKNGDDARVDKELHKLRAEYEAKHPDEVLDFYYPPLSDRWMKQNNKKEGKQSVKKYDLSKFADNLGDSTDFGDEVAELLRDVPTRAVLLYGPAGTGKTWTAQRVAELYEGRVAQVQFHPAYSYEDFMEGLRPERGNNGQISYEVKDGVFKKFCTKARKNTDEKHLFIIDEINRGNVPKVMGELMYCLEYRGEKHALKLPYSKLKNDKELKSDESETFFIPDNVHILGTMNSSDRSVALLDVALRRRFSFVELRPEPELLEKVWVGSEKRLDLSDLLRKLNQRILKWKGRHYLLGHSYFMPPNFKDRQTESEWTVEAFKARWFHQILPLLEEYFADDLKALREVIGSGWEESDAPRDMDPFVPLQPHSLNDRRFIELLIALAGSQLAEGISGDDE